jgi:hypothetical protein
MYGPTPSFIIVSVDAGAVRRAEVGILGKEIDQNPF